MNNGTTFKKRPNELFEITAKFYTQVYFQFLYKIYI